MAGNYRVVVIGGGVIGASVLYHLAKLGWRDIALFERKVLTAGSSWHAAGSVHALNADPQMAALQSYTIDLLPKIAEESGRDIGLHLTGGITIASAPERWRWLRAAYRIFQTIGINDCHLMTAAQIRERCPIINTEGVLGGLWAQREGHIDPSAVVHAYAAAAARNGAKVVEHCKVEALRQLPGGEWLLTTEQGEVRAEHVVNAAGLWAKQVGRMAGVELPLAPLAHHYLITENIPEVEKMTHELPMMVDLEGFTYLRQEQKGALIGIYETRPQHWHIDGAPWDYGMELIPEDTDRIADELQFVFRRYPPLARAGVKRWVNGAFTFSPDGNPLVGPLTTPRNYWLACGVMAGFLQGGGVGKSLAEWMISGEAQTDIWAMDIARYGDFAANREYIRQTTKQFYARRFVMAYPNEQLPAGRPLRKSPSYMPMTAAGCRWGCTWSLETPLFFAPPDFAEKPSLLRSNAHDIVGEECRAVRGSCGLLDITAFSRFEIRGDDAKEWLDKLLAGRLPQEGRIRLSPMLAADGRLKGDLTVFNWGGGVWWLMGSYYLRHFHLRWFLESARQYDDISVRDISDAVCGMSVAGPRARDILGELCDAGIIADIPFMGCANADIGLVRARIGRLSVAGELGYEINCAAAEHQTLRDSLLAAGESFGIREYGFYALDSLRLEKSFGVWGKEYTQSYTAKMTGLDKWMDFDKGDFCGRDAAQKDKPAQMPATLEVDADDADASGFEPVWKNGERIGFITSGGYGHCVGKSLALALIDTAHLQECEKERGSLTVHIVGEERAARVIAHSPYDPAGAAMRG
ncbi:MAG: GcvT family protein [Gammaproteobacteria bacterium]